MTTRGEAIDALSADVDMLMAGIPEDEPDDKLPPGLAIAIGAVGAEIPRPPGPPTPPGPPGP